MGVKGLVDKAKNNIKNNLLTPKSDGCYFLLTMLPLNQTLGHENQGNNHQLKQLFIIIQIFFVSTLGKCIVNSVEIMDIS